MLSVLEVVYLVNLYSYQLDSSNSLDFTHFESQHLNHKESILQPNRPPTPTQLIAHLCDYLLSLNIGNTHTGFLLRMTVDEIGSYCYCQFASKFISLEPRECVTLSVCTNQHIKLKF